MKKLLKAIGIAIVSIVGLVVVAAAVAVWCVFTPERVTPVVRSVADRFITCEWDIGEVEMTFFSTFPEFGIKVGGLYLVNPMPGAQSDTVAVVKNVVAKLNVKDYLLHNNLVVRELCLSDLTGNIYINQEGYCNASVFYLAPDTATQDTSAFALPFDSIVVNGCAINAQRLTFVNQKDSMDIRLNESDIRLSMAYWDDIRLKAQLQVESFKLKEETYAHHVTLGLDVPAELDLQTMHITLNDAELAVNEFGLAIEGDLTLGDSIPMDLSLTTGTWQIQPLLALLPPSVQQTLDSIDIDGQFTLNATAKGRYAENEMPLIDAHLQLQKGHARYAPLPYTFDPLSLDASAHMDLNNKVNSQVIIQKLTASTLESSICLKGCINDVLGQMRTQAHVDVNAVLPDWAYFLPETMQLDGHVKGGLNLTVNLADLSAKRFNSVKTQATISVANLSVQMDSLSAQLDQASIGIEASLKDWPVVNADLTLQSGDQLQVKADSLDATILAPNLTAKATLDTQDTTRIPTFSANINWKELAGYYTSYKGQIGASQLEVKMTSSRRDQGVPVFSATLSSHDIDAWANKSHITTKSLDVDAKSLYRKNGENILLTWNPKLKFLLNGAEADLEGLDQHVSIPQIAFHYSNRDFNIISSSILLGKSDFSLTGNIHGIGKWLAKKDILSGELTFSSNHTDVNELLTLFSADTGSEETTTQTETTTTTTTEKDPFLVPNDVDLTLNTVIKEAEVMNETLKNLGGRVYIKEGTLVLEEMGFVCDAAKLQLTAMYRTPRRNHIYVGLDYHMLDVKIEQLISMIPQIDSMVPMLRSFKGEAEFHLAAETYLKADYSIKTSTLRGGCSIFGKDLVVMDSETFDKISKLLSFKKKTENKVDSISAEITLYKDEVDIYPFCVTIDNYMAAIGGRHHLDMSFDYHVNLLSPIYLGVDINGTMDNLSIKPAKCIYAKDFKPILHKQVDTQNAELRQIIRNSLRRNVKIQ